ncbi:thioredoxin domain-containing protein [Caldimonas brevitalea]|uniref:Thioredoxin n=1 Tax=Caldimonas brevitalea TaxID=413882 RepID=A0A0G3BQG9_9BURK|nr:thioredoxin domain-containing protein [Caldimonas brevitalea]AKJ29616.1 thioredoxin [Caldimonas brevitalea]
MPNRLAQETSPYLQQHAENPVEWYPWGDEALALARETGRPILLSIGYSACHWCHVMAHECFEDEGTAALMNRGFVNIKVDREERPDLDQIYQSAHQLITRRAGGWPLTMFLTPEAQPFFGGTYFPKRSRYRLPGFDDLLKRVAQAWQTQREQLEAQGQELVRYLSDTLPTPEEDAAPLRDRLERAAAEGPAALREAMMAGFDAAHGGFGDAPKFPQSSSLSALLRQAWRSNDRQARDAVLFTLRRMAEGGLFDHLGGGFFRYSTDVQWQIPHFEKMLYDNGPLLRLYAQGWQLTGSALFRQVCEETAAWLMREMQGPDGGYFSSMDADSEGEEGRYYLWRPEQVKPLLAPAEYAAFAARYGLDTLPNFEQHAWHLRLALPLEEVVERAGASLEQVEADVAGARRRLLSERERRPRPGRDDKVLTSWNALTIDAMAFAGRVFGRPDWIASARRALEFVRRALWQDGRLLATSKDGRSHLNAYLDDHTFLLAAVLELMQSDGPVRHDDLQFALAVADAMLARFEDTRDGGFYFTSHDHERLLVRPKTGHDGALPSGNGMAARQLQRLGHLLGEPRYLAAAGRTMTWFATEMIQLPHGFATLAEALDEHAHPPSVVVLSGPAASLADWTRALDARYRPDLIVVQLPEDTQGLPSSLHKPVGARPHAWLCRGTQCLPAVDQPDALCQLLDGVGP